MGSLRDNDGEGAETLSLLVHLVHLANLPKENFFSGQERDNHRLELTSSLNRKIRKISIESRAVTAKKCTKKCDAPGDDSFV